MQHFYDFLHYRNADSVYGISSSPVGPGRVIPSTLVACLKPNFNCTLPQPGQVDGFDDDEDDDCQNKLHENKLKVKH